VAVEVLYYQMAKNEDNVHKTSINSEEVKDQSKNYTAAAAAHKKIQSEH